MDDDREPARYERAYEAADLGFLAWFVLRPLIVAALLIWGVPLPEGWLPEGWGR